MTESEYLARLDSLYKQLTSPQDLRGPAGMGLTNHPIPDVIKAIAALKAEYAAQIATTAPATSYLTTFSRD